MNYKKLTGIVLKKTNYGEADKIITLFTREKGKIRALTKSVRLLKSKLSGSLQDMSVVDVEIVQSGHRMPKLISVKPVKTFQSINGNLEKSSLAFYAAEILLKFSADEQPNTPAFELFCDFMAKVDGVVLDRHSAKLLASAYSLKMTESFGYSYSNYLKNSKIPTQLKEKVDNLESADFDRALKMELSQNDTAKIYQSVMEFVEYILERSIKSHNLLSNI